MKKLADFARFVYFSNILIGVAAVALCSQTSFLLGFSLPIWFYVLMFSNTIFQYGLHDLFTKQGATNRKPILSSRMDNHSYFRNSVIASVAVSTFCFFFLNWEQILWLGILGVLTLAYSFPILPFPRLRRFKTNGVLKLLVLVVVWTLATAVLPATFIPHGYNLEFWWAMAFRFFYMLAICIPFDVRDNITDAKTARHTLVSLFGEKGCYHLSYAAIVIAALLLLPGYFLAINRVQLFALGISLLLTGWMIYYSSRHIFSARSYIMLDAAMIIQALLVCAAILIP